MDGVINQHWLRDKMHYRHEILLLNNLINIKNCTKITLNIKIIQMVGNFTNLCNLKNRAHIRVIYGPLFSL